MRILFVLEPVIFRNDPTFLTAHFMWVEIFRRYAEQSGGEFALAANPATCREWRSRTTTTYSGMTFELDPFLPLGPFNHVRDDYAQSLFTRSNGNPLSAAILEVRHMFEPTIAVRTSQNSHIDFALTGLPTLFLEQAPLPRFGQPARTQFDPCGHQVGSILQQKADEIRGLSMPLEIRSNAHLLLQILRGRLSHSGHPAIAALRQIKANEPEKKIALLATQPDDWVTYEGAFKPIKKENLLFAWANALPPGWIGVPTYHPSEAMSVDLESALIRSCPRLKLLPQPLSQGTTELLVDEAEGLVTLSSTSAASALLFGKQVVVQGKSPFQQWAVSEVNQLDQAKPLTESEATNLFVVLTHHFTQLNSVLESDSSILRPLLDLMISGRPVEPWFLDMTAWSFEKAVSLFPQ